MRLGAKVVGASYEAASGSSSSDEQRIRLKLAPSSSPSKDKDDDDADLLFDKVIFASPAGCCNDAVSALMPSWHSPKAPLDDGGSNKEEASDENSATISTGADHGNITGFLGHFRSHTSEIVVHSDKSVMPKYQYLWASWTVRPVGMMFVCLLVGSSFYEEMKGGRICASRLCHTHASRCLLFSTSFRT